MSFILDALKKSEAERQRQSGPNLLQVRMAPPRGRLPLWAVLIGALLLVNLGILAAVLLHRSQRVEQATADTPPAASRVNSIPTRPATGPSVPVIPPAAFPQPSAATEVSGEEDKPARNPADFEPAVPRASVEQPADELGETLPTMQELAGAGLPPLQLNLHAYDPAQTHRFVWINMKPLREGEATAEGVRVERIVASGVVLSWQGRRFILPRGE